MNPRATARLLANAAIALGEPLAWFEELYKLAASSEAIVPWADECPNPNLLDLILRLPPISEKSRALKIGCGLGDDAEWMASLGWNTTAFDIAPTAIDECRRRFPQSMVEYCVADLLQGLAAWCAGFDVVVESYTLQVLPPVLRRDAMAAIARFVKADGLLLVIARGREESEAAGEMPWPLTQAEACSFQEYGLQLCFFRDYLDTETPPVRRFQLCFQKQGNGGSPVSD